MNSISRKLLNAVSLAASLMLNARVAAAQSEPITTRSGIYTDAQAERGRRAYLGTCKLCHQPSTGAVFEKHWKGRSVADMLSYMNAQMPKNDPGSLEPQQYADLAAYLFKMNAMPSGPTELASDLSALTSVMIEMPAKAASSTTVIKPVKQQPPRKKGD